MPDSPLATFIGVNFAALDAAERESAPFTSPDVALRTNARNFCSLLEQ
jgi:hypothetical protein